MSDISKHLGQVSQYESKYNPGLLVRESRLPNREAHDVDPTKMVGFDIWNIYEVSFLTDNGLPVVGYGKLVYPSDNEYIVESKSLKLYFFSYNMEKMGGTVADAIDTVEQQVVIDLSALLETKVEFKFFHANEEYNAPYKTFTKTEDSNIPYNFEHIDSLKGVEDIMFFDFAENKELLQVTKCNNWNLIGSPGTAITSSMLRSNCKITHQPDWGDVYVYYRSEYVLDPLSFIQYIVSFRNENHFHEEVVEMIYTALFNALKIDENSDLMVAAHYTRRGGIDINPIRATHPRLLDEGLIDVKVVVEKTSRQ